MSKTNRAVAVVMLVAALGGAQAAEPTKARRIEISVTEEGFEPTPIKVKQGQPLLLVVTRKTDATCATTLVLDEAKISADLPLNKAVELPFTPSKSGKIKYGCTMGKMIAGVLLVE